MTADFDQVYARTRARLLLQTWTLTGDQRVAKNSVRDAFIHAAHHWRKVSQLEDPEPWLRTHAWQAAQRRQVARRVWVREKGTSPEVRATLDALARLTPTQRKLLILNHLTSLALPQMAREVGVTQEVAERELQLATSRFSIRREVPSTAIRAVLEEPREAADAVRWPRSPLVWRTGAARRRAHTSAGVAVTVAAVLLGGHFLGGPDRVVAAVTDPSTSPTTVPTPTGPGLPSASVQRVAADAMLGLDQVKTLARHRNWHQTGDGPIAASTADLPCRVAAAADRGLVAGLVRTFSTATQGSPVAKADEVVEQSASVQAAQASYATTLGWYAACEDPHVQLLSAQKVSGVGDDSALLVMRKWTSPVRTWSVGVARTGTLVTSTIVTSSVDRVPGPLHVAQLLGQAVSGLCRQPGAGSCPGRPSLAAMPIPPVGTAPAMLSVVDLPPVSGLTKAWVGTEPQQADVNPAATTCEAAEFTKPVTHGTTRSFLVPGATLPSRFGISESVGTLAEAKARNWIDQVRGKLASCGNRQLGTKVTTLARRTPSSKSDTDVSAWHLRIQLSDKDTVDIDMAVVRDGTALAQVSFISAPGHDLAPGAFVALAERALARLPEMPRP